MTKPWQSWMLLCPGWWSRACSGFYQVPPSAHGQSQRDGKRITELKPFRAQGRGRGDESPAFPQSLQSSLLTFQMDCSSFCPRPFQLLSQHNEPSHSSHTFPLDFLFPFSFFFFLCRLLCGATCAGIFLIRADLAKAVMVKSHAKGLLQKQGDTHDLS